MPVLTFGYDCLPDNCWNNGWVKQADLKKKIKLSMTGNCRVLFPLTVESIRIPSSTLTKHLWLTRERRKEITGRPSKHALSTSYARP